MIELWFTHYVKRRGRGVPVSTPSAILEFYIWFRFRPHHITALDMSFCTILQNFIQIGPPTLSRKNDVIPYTTLLHHYSTVIIIVLL